MFSEILKLDEAEERDIWPFVDCDFSFENKRLCSLFHFVDYLLGILGKVNTLFQQKYLLIWEAWSVVNSLKKHLVSISSKIQWPHPSLPYLSSLDTQQRREFAFLIEQLVQIINVRFSSPSRSIGQRNKKTQPIDSKGKPSELLHHSTNCPIADMFDVFAFDTSIKPMPSTLFGNHQELMKEIAQARRELQQSLPTSEKLCEMRSPISDNLGFIVEMKWTLFDCFHFIEREKYPLLWKENVKLRTIIPTTVSCEQSFSVMKNTLHKTKSTATVFANMTTKYQQTKEIMIL